MCDFVVVGRFGCVCWYVCVGGVVGVCYVCDLCGCCV